MVDCTPHIRSAAVTYRSIRQSAFPLCAFRRTQILAHRQVLQAREWWGLDLEASAARLRRGKQPVSGPFASLLPVDIDRDQCHRRILA